MRAAAIAAVVVAAFVGVMYLRFASDSVPKPPPGAAVGGPQCVLLRDVSNEEDDRRPESTCGPSFVVEVFKPPPPVVVEPTRAPPPDSIGGVKVMPLEIGAEIQLPADIALIVPPTCGGCLGPSGGLSRVYRDLAGRIRTDSLATVESLGFAFGPKPSYFTGYTANPDASAIAVSVCAASCDVEPGSVETTILQSLDGGISWSRLEGPGSATTVVGILPDRRVIAGRFYVPEAPEYEISPGGEALIAPSGASGWPIVHPTGDLFWPANSGNLVQSDGTQWLSAPTLSDQLQFTWKFAFESTGERVLVSATTRSDRSPGAGLLLLFGIDGTLERAYSAAGFVDPVAWLDEHRALVNANRCDSAYSFCPGSQPSVIDLEAGVLYPIIPAFDPSIGTFSVMAVQRGPFARVVSTDNTCLNIRAELLPSAGILDCAAEGVLLRDLGEATDFAGSTWLHVATPAGAVGWANAAYLERELLGSGIPPNPC